jgi:death on curing protein
VKYFDVEALLRIAAHAIDPQEVKVREWGLLSASSARPQTVAFGFEPYLTVPEKAAALLVSLALNHALVDGNKRLALAAALAFCKVNTGFLPAMTNDAAYDMVIAVCEHRLDVPEVAETLRAAGIPNYESQSL